MEISQQLSQPFNEPDLLRPAADRKTMEAARTGGKEEQLQAAAKQFESIFVHQMLKQMQEDIQESSFDPEDSSNGQVHGLYTTFLADAVCEQGGVGLWEKIYEQMNQMTAPGGPETLDAAV